MVSQAAARPQPFWFCLSSSGGSEVEWGPLPCTFTPASFSRVRCPIPEFPAIQSRKSAHCWEQIGQDTGIPQCFLPLPVSFPLGPGEGTEPWGGGSLHQGTSGLGWSEPMGELRAEAKAQEAASLGPYLVPISSPSPYSTPGSPRHNGTMSAPDPVLSLAWTIATPPHWPPCLYVCPL